MLIAISFLVFATVAVLVTGLTMRSERQIVRERIRRHAEYEFGEELDSVKAELSLPFRDRIIQPFLGGLSRLALRMTPAGTLQHIEAKLEMAGRPWNLGSREYLGLKVLSIIVLTGAGFALSILLHISPLLRILLFAVFAGAGFGLPEYLLHNAVIGRQMKIRKVLPDTLDLLLVSVEAGLGLDGAMQKVTEKLHSPLSDELNRALSQVQVGKPRVDALREMANRANVQELSSFVAAVCQAEVLGVSIANVLRVQSESVRNQRAQKIRELTAKLPVKMLFPLVFFIFPAIFVVLLAPAAIIICHAFGLAE
ncbi:MAG: type II secretion system F family protein [Armatimonadota bacterium]